MSSSPRDYYKILGVTANAPADEIKRRYRELARRYHPDVNPSPEAANKIKSINEAYHHLGDSDRRALYDAERLLKPEPGDRGRLHHDPSGGAYTQGRTYRNVNGAHPSQQEHGSPGARAGYDGFGRIPYNQTRQTGGAKQTTQNGAGQNGAGGVASSIDRLVTDAKLAYISRRYNEAERLCRQALAMDRKVAPAHEILGDIYARRGEHDRATTAYAYAIQFNPRNQDVQNKLERMMGSNIHRSKPKTYTRPLRQPLMLRLLNSRSRDTILVLTSLISLSALGVVLYLFFENPGTELLIGEFTSNLIGALAGSGILVGILLALYGGVRPISQELVIHQKSHQSVGLSGPLVLFSFVWFYLSLFVYLVISIRHNKLSASVLRAYGTTLALSILFCILYQMPMSRGQMSFQAAAFAGNLLFPAILAGWRIGDWLRLGGV